MLVKCIEPPELAARMVHAVHSKQPRDPVQQSMNPVADGLEGNQPTQKLTEVPGGLRAVRMEKTAQRREGNRDRWREAPLVEQVQQSGAGPRRRETVYSWRAEPFPGRGCRAHEE